MPDIHGNTEGIRQSVLNELKTLYDYPFEPDEFAPEELARVMAGYSARFNREIALYVSRGGDVLDIVIGAQDNVTLPSVRLRRSEKRLSMVRVLHTHPRAPAELSDVDLTALRSLYLDAIMAIGTDTEGNVTGVSCAFLGERENGVPTPIVSPILPLKKLPQSAWMRQIDLSDELVKSGEDKQENAPERALLLSIDSEESLKELAALAESAGAVVVGQSLQKKDKPDTGTYVGSGKADALALDAQALEADLIIADDELTAIQTRNLEAAAGVRVIDRTTLILDIFAQRAKTGEGKLQVSMAQLKYRQSRLIGQGLVLSRLAGGIGTRGPGESKLEIDRRRIRERLTDMRRQLADMEAQRALQRKQREKSGIPTVALVGYTNTGKSTLLNRVTDADVYVQNQLFATLDAVSRKVTLPEGDEFLLTDTVGFIRKLPTDLVEAFKSTLEEAVRADLLVIVTDISSPDALKQHLVVEQVLRDLKADAQPRIDALNKCDEAGAIDDTLFPGAVKISAKTGEGVDALLQQIALILRKRAAPFRVLVPFSAYQMMNDLRLFGRILDQTHTDEGTLVTAALSTDAVNQLKARWGQAFLPKKMEENAPLTR